ncbi:hypothetical protein ACGFSG_38290 [Streptomyces sp. NPDC048512]|uniref:hypothetical protein n=1 Tax=Streptomyces sp. NPDC048512 TaxID=3365563 RepID=UPI003710DF9A
MTEGRRASSTGTVGRPRSRASAGSAGTDALTAPERGLMEEWLDRIAGSSG